MKHLKPWAYLAGFFAMGCLLLFTTDTGNLLQAHFAQIADRLIPTITQMSAGNSEPQAPDTLTDLPVVDSADTPVLPDISFLTEVVSEVDDRYFDDAAFIGDSRIVGLMDYGNLEGADFFCSSGLTIYRIFEDPIKPTKDGHWDTPMEQILTEKQYGKIYLCLGINELGMYDTDHFIETFNETLLRIRELQPNALIYILSIMCVTQSRDDKHDYISNEAIFERNVRLLSLADFDTVFFLDINEAVTDENHALTKEYSGDGVHLYAKYMYLWTDYLKSHAIVFETAN